jgi:hypothetical protein
MGVPNWSWGTRQRDQMSFCLSVNPPWSVPTGGTALQCGGQTLLNKLLAHPPNGRGADLQRLTDLFIRPAWSF